MSNAKKVENTTVVAKKNASVFETLNAINVNGHTEKKNGLTYLSWAWAWAEVKKLYPDANYVIYETTNPNGYTCNYFTDGRTCWVKTGIIINGLEHIEELPVMDFRNQSIMLDKVTSFDVNKAIQRSLTKAVARHGLGLYIYAGEDLPEEETQNAPKNEELPFGDPAVVEKITNAQIKKIMELKVIIPNVLKRYNVKDLVELSYQQAEEIISIKEQQLNK